MKKLIFSLFIMTLIITGCQKNDNSNKNNTPSQLNQNQGQNQTLSQEDLLNDAKKQLTNYQNYKFDPTELSKIAIGDNDDIYYYAADNKRYVFPNLDIFKSWFGDYDISKLPVHDLETLYKTSLGGNVTLRPGSLLKTETDYNTYIVIKDGQIRTLAQSILEQVFGNNWSEQVYDLPNYYFTHYYVGNSILTLRDFPKIPLQITIDQDKNFK